MDRWEHRTVYISRVGGEWQVDYGSGDVTKGLDHVLDEYGSKGWELVSLFPQAWRTESGQFGPFEATAYRAVFKRRAEAAT
jgi:hypothetical protein